MVFAQSMNMRLFSPLRPSGIVPSSLFLAKFISCRDERLPRDSGLTPVKLFFLRFMTLSGKPPGQAGISPVKKFESSLTPSRLVQFFNWVVISPCSVLLDKLRCCNRGRWPTDSGISTCNLLELRSRILKNVRLTVEEVIVQEKPWEVRFRTVTMSLRLRLQLTPGQWQNLAVVFHAARTPCCWLRLALISSGIPSSGFWLPPIVDLQGTVWSTYPHQDWTCCMSKQYGLELHILDFLRNDLPSWLPYSICSRSTS